MHRFLIKAVCLLLLAMTSLSVFSQTYFYKRISIVENGVRQATNDDAHYMTFGQSCVYDSDAEGYMESNSNMRYKQTQNNIKTYYGTCYYGLCYCYVATDNSRINLKVGDQIYVYVKCSPNDGATRRVLANNRSNPVVNGGVPTYSNPVNTPVAQPDNRPTRRSCPMCNGSGKYGDEIVYQPNYTGSYEEVFCNVCGQWKSPHSHRQKMCMTCYGRGYMEF